MVIAPVFTTYTINLFTMSVVLAQSSETRWEKEGRVGTPVNLASPYSEIIHEQRRRYAVCEHGNDKCTVYS